MKNKISCLLCIVLWLFSPAVFAQAPVTITGHVKNSKTGENLPAVSITIKGTSSVTFTDDKGNFKLVTTQQPPFTIVISSVGYADKEVQVTSAGSAIDASIDPAFVLGQDIVVAASRVPDCFFVLF